MYRVHSTLHFIGDLLWLFSLRFLEYDYDWEV